MKLLVNIEGNDGTGKRTVANKLKKLWEEEYAPDQIDCRIIDFPAYDSLTGKLVKEFLHGSLLGDPTKAEAYTSSIPYTLDRLAYYQAHYKELENVINDEDDKLHIIICNRSYLSNYFYQGSKLLQMHEVLCPWLNVQHRLEIESTLISEFDPMTEIVNIYLTPRDLSENLEKLKARGESLDLNEQNSEYLERVEQFALHAGYDIIKNIAMENRWALYYLYDIVMIPFGKSPVQINLCVEHAALTISTMMQDRINMLLGEDGDIDGN